MKSKLQILVIIITGIWLSLAFKHLHTVYLQEKVLLSQVPLGSALGVPHLGVAPLEVAPLGIAHFRVANYHFMLVKSIFERALNWQIPFDLALCILFHHKLLRVGTDYHHAKALLNKAVIRRDDPWLCVMPMHCWYLESQL